LRLFLHPHKKFGEDQTICNRVIAYFQFSKRRPSAILDFKFSQFLSKIQIIAHFSQAKLGEDLTIHGQVIPRFQISNDGRPPSWIVKFSQ